MLFFTKRLWGGLASLLLGVGILFSSRQVQAAQEEAGESRIDARTPEKVSSVRQGESEVSYMQIGEDLDERGGGIRPLGFE